MNQDDCLPKDAYRVKAMAVPDPFTIKRDNQGSIHNRSLSVLCKKGKPTSFVPSIAAK